MQVFENDSLCSTLQAIDNGKIYRVYAENSRSFKLALHGGRDGVIVEKLKGMYFKLTSTAGYRDDKLGDLTIKTETAGVLKTLTLPVYRA